MSPNRTLGGQPRPSAEPASGKLSPAQPVEMWRAARHRADNQVESLSARWEGVQRAPHHITTGSTTTVI